MSDIEKRISQWQETPECELRLERLGLDKIPHQVIGLEQPIRKLSLVLNSLTTISSKILEVHKDMISLDVSSNNFANADNNAEQELHTTIRGLTKLEKLQIAENSIRDPTSLFGAIKTLSNLKELNVRKFDTKYQLGRCLAHVEEMTHLRVLCLSECNIHGFPSFLSTLTILESLDLSFNHMTVIPNDIAAFGSLKTLRLEGCGISYIDEGLCELTNLSLLDLSMNELAVMPAGLQKMESLQQLLLSFNNFDYREGFYDDLMQSPPPALQALHLIGNLVAPEIFALRENIRDGAFKEGNVHVACVPPELLRPPSRIIQKGVRPPGCDEELYYELYLGDYTSAKNKHMLDQLGVRSVLIVGDRLFPLYPSRYKYLQFEIEDDESEHLMVFFKEGTEFIHRQRKKGGVLVHCAAGISRSASLVIAYYIRYYQMSYDEAHQEVLRRRDIIFPNNAFIEQLKVFAANLEHKNCYTM